MDAPDVVNDAEPPGGNPNDPASGTYGDKIELENLRQAMPGLPGVQPGQPGGVKPLPPMTPRPGNGMPTGLPKALFDKTNYPDTPVSTPLSQPTPVGGTSKEQRIQLLDAYARDPTFSAISRALFARYRDKLIRASD